MDHRAARRRALRRPDHVLLQTADRSRAGAAPGPIAGARTAGHLPGRLDGGRRLRRRKRLLRIVPRTHDLPRLCTVEADLSQSFSASTVPIPPGSEAAPVIMQAGDVVFFNGQVIHGSYPNTSATRFRRALIAHYIVGEAEKGGGVLPSGVEL